MEFFIANFIFLNLFLGIGRVGRVVRGVVYEGGCFVGNKCYLVGDRWFFCLA